MNVNKVHGINTFALPQWNTLPPLLRCYARAGWYQGSLFFAMAGKKGIPFPPLFWVNVEYRLTPPDRNPYLPTLAT